MSKTETKTYTGSVVPIEMEEERAEYAALIESLRPVIEDIPGWLYDQTGLGDLCNALDEAIWDWDQKHPR